MTILSEKLFNLYGEDRKMSGKIEKLSQEKKKSLDPILKQLKDVEIENYSVEKNLIDSIVRKAEISKLLKHMILDNK